VQTVCSFCLFATSVVAQAVTPFTITSISRQYDAAGRVAGESRFLIAVDRYGSLASVELSPTTQPIRQILDTVNHAAILIDSNSRMASATPYIWSRNHGDCAHGFFHMIGASVSVERSAGTIQGVPVEHVVVDAPHHHSEAFLAPLLAARGSSQNILDLRRLLPQNRVWPWERAASGSGKRLCGFPAVTWSERRRTLSTTA